MKNFKHTNSAHNGRAFLSEVIHTYRNEDGTLNKIAIFISALALILVLLLGHFVITSVSAHWGLNSVAASELTLEEIEDAITNSFTTALSEYVDGEYTQDELCQKVLQAIGDYLNNSGKFTDSQIADLNLLIGDYLNNTTISQDIKDNASAISDIQKMIEEKYSENRNYISDSKNQLQSLLDDNSNLDTDRYNEIKNLINNMNTWLDDSNSGNKINLNDLRKDLLDLISDLEKNTNLKIDDLKNTLTNNINELEQNTADSINSTNTTIANYFGFEGWSADINYSKSDYVSYNQKFYHSLAEDNLGNNPADSTKYWEEVDIVTLVNLLQGQIDELDSHISDLNNSNYKFQYGYDDNGCAGYYIDGQFKPF